MRTYPRSYTQNIPDLLAPTKDLPSQQEKEISDRVRKQFMFDGDNAPYMTDVIRAMRLLKGRRRYVEVGTYDKGCLAYVSSLLAPDALLVDVDIEARELYTTRLSGFLRPTQKLVTIVGDSTSPAVLSRVKEAVGPEGADCVFIDGNHTAQFCWADYGNFLDVLAPGGLMLFHDVYWHGAPDCNGVSMAMEWIDRVHPVHVVFGEGPVHRFFPHMVKNDPLWGGVAIINP